MDQPRVPAGNPNGGQWTSKHGGWGRGATGFTYTNDSDQLSDEDVRRHTRVAWGREVSRDTISKLAGAQLGSQVTISHDSIDEEIFPPYQKGSLRVDIQFMGPDGFPIGSAARLIGPTKIYNAEFLLDRGFRGQGRGMEVFSQQVNEASKHGYAMIETKASGMGPAHGGGGEHDLNGYYTWARLGYDGIVSGPNGSPISIHKLMGAPNGASWWKQNGRDFDATFSLRPNSNSLRVFNEYRRLKGIL